MYFQSQSDPPNGTICWPAIWARFAAGAPHRPELAPLGACESLLIESTLIDPFFWIISAHSEKFQNAVLVYGLRRSAHSTGSLVAHFAWSPLARDWFS
jgi:hypothetical protein